jgi:hypothetical protein
VPGVVVTSSWPIVILVCPRTFGPAWVSDLETGFRDVFERRSPFALVVDTTAVTSLPAALERKAMTDWASRPDQLALQKELNVGSSTIVKNAVMRGSLQALYWLWTPASPQHAARDFDDAWNWCLSMLEKRDVRVDEPRALRRLADRDRGAAAP